MDPNLLVVLEGVGIIDGLIFGVAVLFLTFKSIMKPVVKAAPVLPPPPVVSAKEASTKKLRASVAEALNTPPKAAPQKVVLPPDDGLGVLIESARKNSDKCSVCAAYVIFYDKGKFRAEGMTASGMMAHFDASHKS